jgi:mono/diheme cytochrome c family protein
VSGLKTIAAACAAAACAVALGACGEQSIAVKEPTGTPVHNGAELFLTHCSGCHTLSAATARGSTPQGEVNDKERTDGPNLDYRREDVDSVLFAIRNGGFSGAIMPANVVVGEQAQQVADFVSKYAGSKAEGSGSGGSSSGGTTP